MPAFNLGKLERFRTPSLGNMSFTLTPLGKQKADEYNGDKESRIMVALDEMGGTGSVSDIASQSGMNKREVEKVLWHARRHGKVRSIRGEV